MATTADDAEAFKAMQSDPRFQAVLNAASSSSSSSALSLFHLLEKEFVMPFPDHAETLVRRAGLVLGLRVGQQPVVRIDLKTGPLPRFSQQPQEEQPEAEDCGDFDVVVSVDSAQRLAALMSRQEDGAKAYALGHLKLEKSSMRALLKLRSLQDVGERWRQDVALTGSITAPTTSQQQFQGYVDKQSDWVRRWKPRYAVLQWSDTGKPVLKLFTCQADFASAGAVPPKHVYELHSQILVRFSSSSPPQIQLVDPRRASSQQILCTLQCSSDRSRDEWARALSSAIHARNAAVERARSEVGGSDGASSSSSLLDLLLATQRMCTRHEAELAQQRADTLAAQERVAQLAKRVQDADDLVIYTTSIESDAVTLLRAVGGWRAVPVMAVVLYVLAKVGARAARWLGRQHAGVLAGLLMAGTLVARRLAQDELAVRRIKVYRMALGAIWRIKLSMLKADHQPALHSQAMFNVEFRAQAELLYGLALELRGLWVKTAQFLGARPDVVPEHALQVLKRLHDDVPATPFAAIRSVVEHDLGGAKLEQVFSRFETDPLASASIGQVHVADMLIEGEGGSCKVVVKVQHPGVHVKIEQDLVNMEQIVRIMDWIEPGLQGQELVREWSREVRKELDFSLEARNMLEVGANLAKHGTEVHACLPVPLRYTARTLVMRFVHGAKVNDLDVLRRVAGVDTVVQRQQLAKDICDAYAHQIFLDGVFQADAHPGNILVCRRSELDPTAVQFLPPVGEGEEERAIPVLLDFGLTKHLPNNKRLAFSRLICAMAALDVSQLLLSFDEMGLRLKREDPFEDLEEFRFAFRDSSDAQQSREETMQHLNKARQKLEAKPLSERNPVESFPKELLLFFRTIALLRGLCVSLAVPVPYLRILSGWAKRALREESAAAESCSQAEGEARAALSPLEASLRRTLAEETKTGGVQVCVLLRGEQVVDLCWGTTHAEVEMQPVTSSTLFPCLGLGQAIAQLAVRSVLAGQQQEKKRRVQELWPAYGDAELTVDALLSGRASELPFSMSAVPASFYVASMHRWQQQVDFVVSSSVTQQVVKKEALPWELSGLAYSWGWTVVGLVQAVAGGGKGGDSAAYEQVVRARMPGVLARAPESELAPPITTVGAVSEEEDAHRARARERVNAQYAKLTVDLERAFGSAVDLDKMMADAGGGGGDGDMAASANHPMLHALDASLDKKKYLIDPRVMNCPSARSSLSPSCNLLATATALARAFDDGTLTQHYRTLLHTLEEDREKAMPQHLEPLSGDALGIKVFVLKKGKQRVLGFGQVAFGGSMVLCVPQLELSMCVLVNDLTLDRPLTRQVVDRVLHQHELELVSEI